MAKQRVLFICTHNSARSQMAEAMLRAFSPADFDAFSAGTEATSVRTEAIQVMDEIGIDISQHTSKGMSQFEGQPFAPPLSPARAHHTRALIQSLLEMPDLKDHLVHNTFRRAAE